MWVLEYPCECHKDNRRLKHLKLIAKTKEETTPERLAARGAGVPDSVRALLAEMLTYARVSISTGNCCVWTEWTEEVLWILCYWVFVVSTCVMNPKNHLRAVCGLRERKKGKHASSWCMVLVHRNTCIRMYEIWWNVCKQSRIRNIVSYEPMWHLAIT